MTIPQNVNLNAGSSQSFNLVIQNPCNYEGIQLQMSTGLNCICTNDQVYYSISTALGSQFEDSKVSCDEGVGSSFIFELNPSSQASKLLIDKSDNGLDWYNLIDTEISNLKDTIGLGFGKFYSKVKLLDNNFDLLQEETSFVDCQDSKVLLYPNPADNKIVIQNLDFKEILKIDVIDIYGRVLNSYEHFGSEYLNVEMLINGKYELRVYRSNDVLFLPFEILR